MPDTVIRLDADISQITVKFKKVGDQLKDVGEKAAKSFDWTGGFNKMVEALPKKLMTVTAALEAIGTAAKIATNVQDQRASLAGDRNAFALRAARAAMGAGGSQAANRAFIESNGAGALTTLEGRTTFLEGIADLNRERTTKGLPGIPIRDLQRYEGYYNRGGDIVFGKGGANLIDAIKQFQFSNSGKSDVGIGRYLAGQLGIPYRGQDIGTLLQGNLNQLPPDAIAALRASANAEATNRAGFEAGIGGQADLANAEYRKRLGIENPYAMGAAGALKDFFGGIPLVGGTLNSVINLGQRNGASEMALQHLSDISDSMDKMMHRSGSPTLPNMKTRDEYVTAP